MSAAGFFILADTLTPLLEHVAVLEHTQDKMEKLSHEILSYAKANAPWHDISGDAREGLETSVDITGDQVVLSMYHTVDYGKWLELIQSGRYAIIMPTLEHFSHKLMSDVGAYETGGE